MIRHVQLSDAGRIAEIYNYYITNTVITFENVCITSADIEQRIRKTVQNNYPFLVYEVEGIVAGYAYLGPWRERAAYNITLETSIYFDHHQKGRGYGTVLYKKLISEARKMNLHSLVSGISLPNEESCRLHQNLGFELAAHFKQVGKKFDTLIDVVFYQLVL